MQDPNPQQKLFENPGTNTVVLPDVCRNRHRGNPRSEEANKNTHPRKSSTKKRILEFVGSRRDGATTFEIALGLKIPYTTASGRVSDLKTDKKLVASGKTRPTATGSDADVLVLTTPAV